MFKKILKALGVAIKEEVKEIKNLELTDEDKEQGDKVAVMIVAALAGVGVPMCALGQKAIARVLAYVIRDMKDGIECQDKLIIARVINELKK